MSFERMLSEIPDRDEWLSTFRAIARRRAPCPLPQLNLRSPRPGPTRSAWSLRTGSPPPRVRAPDVAMSRAPGRRGGASGASKTK